MVHQNCDRWLQDVLWFFQKVNEAMRQKIVVAGATGNLGGRIAGELRQRGASVRALVRPGTSAAKLASLREQEGEIVEADLHARREVVKACKGASCVVSSLLGLQKTRIDAQGALFDAVVEAEVPRFIPSDFAMDFTKIAPGLNRNLDLHRDFQERCFTHRSVPLPL